MEIEAILPPQIAPASEAFAESIHPDSERTVCKRVPEDLIQRARAAALSDMPPPSFDDNDDRTAVFSPPRDLLLRGRGGASEPAPDRKTPVQDPLSSLTGNTSLLPSDRAPSLEKSQASEPPLISVEAGPTLLPAERSAPPPAFASPVTQPSEPPPLSPSQDDVDDPVDLSPRRSRVLPVLAVLLLLLLLAAGFVYMHSGRSLLIPSSATKNG